MMYIPDPPGPPSITGYTSGQVVRTNDTLHLTCTSRGGNPLGTVVWYRDNERVDSSFTSGGNQAVNEYIFTAMSVDNSMEYRCEVNNLVTSAPLTASVTLTVHCKCLSNIEFSDIAWLIIGHTYATYSHLLLGKPPLVCPCCCTCFNYLSWSPEYLPIFTASLIFVFLVKVHPIGIYVFIFKVGRALSSDLVLLCLLHFFYIFVLMVAL